MADDQGPLEAEPSAADEFAAAITAATDAARIAVTPHITADDSSVGVRFPLDGKVLCLSGSAPQSAVNAASFLTARYALKRAHQKGDIDGAILAAFIVGVLASDTWLAGAKGWSLAGMVSSFQRLDEGRKKGGKATQKWTLEVDERARGLLGELPTSLTEDEKAKRISAMVGVSITTVKNHLFYAER